MTEAVVAAVLVLAVAVAFSVWTNKSRPRTTLPWFAAGAAVWVGGVALKVALTLVVLRPLARVAGDVRNSDAWPFIIAASTALATGVTEIGSVLVFTLLVRRVGDNPVRATAFGFGAGVIESLGVAAFLGASMFLGEALVDLPRAARAELVWLFSPIERVLATLVHASARILTIWAIVGRRMGTLLACVIFLGSADGIVAYRLMVGDYETRSVWFLHAFLLPYAVAGWTAVRWARDHWSRQST